MKKQKVLLITTEGDPWIIDISTPELEEAAYLKIWKIYGENYTDEVNYQFGDVDEDYSDLPSLKEINSLPKWQQEAVRKAHRKVQLNKERQDEINTIRGYISQANEGHTIAIKALINIYSLYFADDWHCSIEYVDKYS